MVQTHPDGDVIKGELPIPTVNAGDETADS